MHRTARTVSAALAISLACGLTACGSGGEGVAADAEQTLTVWAMGAEGEKLGAVAAEYTKANPEIDVKVTPIGWDVAHQKLVSAAAAGTLPDVMQMGSTYMGEFAELGVLEPVDTKTFDKKDFFPAGWEQGVVDGEVYGVPWYVDTRVLYYRTDLAQKAGVGKPPATFAELESMASAYQDKAKTKWGIYLQPRGLDTVQSFYPFLYSAGGEIVDENGKAVVNSPAAVGAFEQYGAFFDKGLSTKSVQPGYDPLKDFNTGNVPMFFSGPWIRTLIDEQYPDLKGKWAVANVPTGKSSTSMAGGSSLVISKDSEHKAAAKEFVAHLTSAQAQADWYRRTHDLPANLAAWSSGELAQDPGMKVFFQQMKTAKSTPTLPTWSEISASVDTALESVTQGKASGQEAAGKAQSGVEDLVSR
ncbi:sugar ABC transporter substrate-binding protein [Streptomyces sp. NBC_01167]|uniref:sugar ABC transporter substrate-binding protein n=1 Tax=Streptomyces sp. NBC_01167 TaxID=2903756 RepID=UPI00386FE3DA|nr:sugar ABC transporter substrate-binding protein [Streptomyces sp. NBC_01167]